MHPHTYTLAHSRKHTHMHAQAAYIVLPFVRAGHMFLHYVTSFVSDTEEDVYVWVWGGLCTHSLQTKYLAYLTRT